MATQQPSGTIQERSWTPLHTSLQYTQTCWFYNSFISISIFLYHLWTMFLTLSRPCCLSYSKKCGRHWAGSFSEILAHRGLYCLLDRSSLQSHGGCNPGYSSHAIASQHEYQNIIFCLVWVRGTSYQLFLGYLLACECHHHTHPPFLSRQQHDNNHALLLQ